MKFREQTVCHGFYPDHRAGCVCVWLNLSALSMEGKRIRNSSFATKEVRGCPELHEAMSQRERESDGGMEMEREGGREAESGREEIQPVVYRNK